MALMVSVSFGELLDKLTILEIKGERIQDPEKLANVRHEESVLRKIWDAANIATDVSNEIARLKKINETLWEIEDDIREKERAQNFDDEFIQLARKVYFTNDERAAVKREIHIKLGSDLIEEKSYSDYGNPES